MLKNIYLLFLVTDLQQGPPRYQTKGNDQDMHE